MEGIYARQSVDKKDSISIDTQIELCQREVSPGKKYKVYKDDGVIVGSSQKALVVQGFSGLIHFLYPKSITRED